MPSARDFITSSMRMLTVLAPGEQPTATDLNDGLTWLNRMIDSWGTQRLTVNMTERLVYPLVVSQAIYTIGPGGDFNQQRPVWLQYVGLLLNNLTPPIEVPLEVLTVKDWTLVGIKDLQSTQPTQVYYNYDYPSTGVNTGLGALQFWPVPQIDYDAVIYTPKAVAQFSDLSTNYQFAPGYEDAIEYNLALRLARPFGQVPPDDIVAGARKYLGDIKRANIKLTDLSIDPAVRPDPGVRYNWRSDTIK